jgi:hypothetical protein
MMDRVKVAHYRADCVVFGAAAIVLAGLVLWTRFSQYTIYIPAPRPAPVAAVDVVPLQAAIFPATMIAPREDQSECLAEVLYYEARGEGMEGQKAVAEVVLQRTKDHNFPGTICGVVYEGAQPSNNKGCQFSFACDGALRQPKERTSWARVRKLAEAIVTGAVKLAGETGHAIAYHSIDVSPIWAETMEETAQIGNHVFYRRDPNAQYRTDESGAEAATVESSRNAAPASGSASDEIQSQIQVTDAVGQGA